MTESIGHGFNKEFLSKDVTIEILDRIYLDVKAVEGGGGKIESVVDDDDNPRDNRIDQDGLLVDELTMDALEEFFANAGVEFVGNPWVARDQEDFLGDISINCADLNKALKNGKLVLSSAEGGDTFSFEGLDPFVEDFSDKHRWEDKYNETEDEDNSDI